MTGTKTFKQVAAACIGTVALAASARVSAGPQSYAITRVVPLKAPDRWDDVAFDSWSARVLVARGNKTVVVGVRDGRVVGEAGPLDGARGQVVAPEFGRGYADSGGSASVNVFDRRTLRPVANLPASAEADAMAYDPSTRRVFVVGGASGVVTAIDAIKDRTVATMLGAGSLEFAAAYGKGQLFVNLSSNRASPASRRAPTRSPPAGRSPIASRRTAWSRTRRPTASSPVVSTDISRLSTP